MSQINFNSFDIESINGIQNIIERLGGKCPDENEVWEFVVNDIKSGNKEIPNFDNILISLTFDELEKQIQRNYPEEYDFMEITFEINCRASFCDINGNLVSHFHDLEEVISEIREDHIEDEEDEEELSTKDIFSPK